MILKGSELNSVCLRKEGERDPGEAAKAKGLEGKWEFDGFQSIKRLQILGTGP